METLADRLAEMAADAPRLYLALTLAGRSLLLFALAGAALLLLRRASAARRHLALLFTLIGLLLLPLFSLLPAARVASLPVLPAPAPPASLAAPSKAADTVLPAAPAPAAPAAPPAVAAPVAVPPAPAPPPSPAAVATARSPLLARVDAFLLAVYAAGVVVLLLAEAVGRWRLRALVRAATPVSDGPLYEAATEAARALGVRQSVRLFLGPADLPPLTFGTRRPALLLPETARGWTPERLRAVLLHETAHILRRDALTQTLARFTCAVWWWHPLAWAAARGVQAESERACDDRVLLGGVAGPDYAAHLVDLVRTRRPGDRAPTALPGPAIAMARGPKLGDRVRAILDARRARHGLSRRGALLGGVLAALLLVPAAVVRLTPRETLSQEAEKASAADPLPPGFGRATLPNGATVEVVALSFNDPDGWERFGRHGDRIAPNRDLEPTNFRRTGPMHAFEVRLLGLEKTPLGVAWRSRSPAVKDLTHRSLGSESANGVLRSVEAVGTATVADGVKDRTADLEFGVALERTVTATVPLVSAAVARTASPIQAEPRAWALAPGTEGVPARSDSLAVRVQMPESRVRDRAYALVAVDRAGKEYTSGATSTGTAPIPQGFNAPRWLEVTLSFDGLKREDLAEVRLLTSPYTWVTLRDVPLRPDTLGPAVGPVSPLTVAPPGHAVPLPDGTTLTLESKRRDSSETQVPVYDFAFRLNGGGHTRYRWTGLSLRSRDVSLFKGRSERRGGVAGQPGGPLLAFDAEAHSRTAEGGVFGIVDVSRVTVRIGLTDDRWQTVASTRVQIGRDGRVRSQTGDFTVRTDPRYPAWLDATLHASVYGRRYRMVAVDNRGREHTVSGSPGETGDDGVGPDGAMPPLHTVREVRLQAAPVYWVEFRDISLRPDYLELSALNGVAALPEGGSAEVVGITRWPDGRDAQEGVSWDATGRRQERPFAAPSARVKAGAAPAVRVAHLQVRVRPGGDRRIVRASWGMDSATSNMYEAPFDNATGRGGIYFQAAQGARVTAPILFLSLSGPEPPAQRRYFVRFPGLPLTPLSVESPASSQGAATAATLPVPPWVSGARKRVVVAKGNSVTLPSGHRVELVSLAEQETNAVWYADGKLIRAPRTAYMSEPSELDGQRSLTVRLRTSARNLPPVTRFFRTRDQVISSSSTNAPNGGTRLEGDETRLVTVPTAREREVFRVGFGRGAYRLVGRTSAPVPVDRAVALPNALVVASGVPRWLASPERTGAEAKVTLFVPPALQDWDLRVVAVDRAGRRFSADALMARPGEGVALADFPGLRPEDVREILVEARPVEWGEFQGVRLYPEFWEPGMTIPRP